MTILWIFLGILGASVLMIILVGIFGESEEEKYQKLLAENRRKATEEEKSKEAERAKIADRLSKSDLFNQLRVKVFAPDKDMPLEIYWREGSRISVKYDHISFDNFTISEDEIPNCLEFMRALGYLYRNEYTYTEYDTVDGCKIYTVTLYKISNPKEKPTW